MGAQDRSETKSPGGPIGLQTPCKVHILGADQFFIEAIDRIESPFASARTDLWKAPVKQYAGQRS